MLASNGVKITVRSNVDSVNQDRFKLKIEKVEIKFWDRQMEKKT